MSNSNLSLSTKVTGRRVSKIFKAPLVEKVREEDGSTTFQCTGPYSSMEDSDSSVGSAYRGRRGNKYGKIDDGLMFFVFILLGGCVSIVLGLVSLLSIVLGEWVLIETAELVGSLALLSSGYLASVLLYGSWYNCCGKSIVLDSYSVVNLVAAYIGGAAVCNLLGFVLRSTTFDLTHLLLLAGWLAVSNSCFQTAMPRSAFLRSEENYLLVACTLVQRTLVRSLFRAFLPPVLLPMIDHSCHLVGLTFTTALHQWVGGVSLTIRGRSATPNYNRRSSSLGNIHQSLVYPYGRKSALSLGKSSRSTQSSISGLVSGLLMQEWRGSHSLLLTAHSLHLTAHSLHLTAHSLHLTAHSLHLTVHSLHLTVHSLHLTAHSLHLTAHSLLLTAHSLLLTAHSLLLTAHSFHLTVHCTSQLTLYTSQFT